MPVLSKAKLAILRPESGSGTPAEVEPGTEQDVQFNPATLRLSLKNVHDANENRGRQVRQHLGADSETYTLELQFDSADQARGGEPLSVRSKTWVVERYLQPRAPGVQPPRLRFTWGDFIVDGSVESLELEFDHFAHTGVPLRARATLTLRRQDSRLEVLPETSRKTGQQTRAPGESPHGAPGGSISASVSLGAVVSAQGGESPAEMAARLGLDPEGWRGLGFDLEAGISGGAGLSFAAGAEVGFEAGVGASVGLGMHVGFEAGVSASLDAQLGLGLGASVTAGATVAFGAATSASLGAGFQLAAAGGVESAIEWSAGAEAFASVSEASAAFGVTPSQAPTGAAPGVVSPASSVAAFGVVSRGGSTVAAPGVVSGPSRPSQDRTPLGRVGMRPGTHVERSSAPPPPRVDPRAKSFGRGVPLRPRVEIRPARPLEGDTHVMPPMASDPITAPWTALPPSDPARRHADAEQGVRRPANPCACACAPERRAPWALEPPPTTQQRKPR